MVDEEASHRFATAVVIRPVTHTHQKVVSPLNCISHFTRVTRVETRDERLFLQQDVRRGEETELLNVVVEVLLRPFGPSERSDRRSFGI